MMAASMYAEKEELGYMMLLALPRRAGVVYSSMIFNGHINVVAVVHHATNLPYSQWSKRRLLFYINPHLILRCIRIRTHDLPSNIFSSECK
jgi:hypothetical protein